MIRLIFNLILLGALCAPGILLSQNNRVSIQTGLFNYFFDGSPIVDKNPNEYKRTLNNLFGGVLNYTWGVQYQRMINTKSSISGEYMTYHVVYNYKRVYNDPTVKPVIAYKGLKSVNITYLRKLHICDKFSFVYGGGLNYVWGVESVYHYTFWNGAWGEPRFYSFHRNDFGLNARTGVEYSPLKWLTLSTNFDFTGIFRLKTTDVYGNNLKDFYKEKFGLTNIPSRYNLSWRFGIGFNF